MASLIAPNFAAVYDYPVPSFGLKSLLLRIARAVGLFALARRRVDGRLLILAYHGVAQADEHEWRPKLFMSRETFQRRLACLRQWQVPVRPLGDGLSELRRGAKAPYAVALTFDDGYHNFADLALPYLETARAGATVYVCTYYSLHTGWPVFDLAVDYMFWKRPAGVVPGDVIGEAEPLTGGQRRSSGSAQPRACTRSPSDRRWAGPRRTRSAARSPRTSITRRPTPSSRAA